MTNDYMNDPEFQELIREYLDFMINSLPELKENIAHADYIKIRQYGHNLTGSGGGYGFDDLTELGRNINTAAHEEDLPLLRNLTKELERNITQKRVQFFPSPLS